MLSADVVAMRETEDEPGDKPEMRQEMSQEMRPTPQPPPPPTPRGAISRTLPELAQNWGEQVFIL
jgi:hypothetical protein